LSRYGDIGRQSVDTELMIRIVLEAWWYGFRCERLLGAGQIWPSPGVRAPL